MSFLEGVLMAVVGAVLVLLLALLSIGAVSLLARLFLLPFRWHDALGRHARGRRDH